MSAANVAISNDTFHYLGKMNNPNVAAVPIKLKSLRRKLTYGTYSFLLALLWPISMGQCRGKKMVTTHALLALFCHDKISRLHCLG